MEASHNQSLKTAEAIMMILSVCFADSVDFEKRQSLPQVLSPQQFKVIPEKGKPIEVKTKDGGTLKVKIVARHASRTKVTVHVIPTRKKR